MGSLKVFINKPRIFLAILKTGRVTKKINKAREGDYIPDLQKRHDYLIKKISILLNMYNVEVRVKGYENLGNGPALLVGNHQDNLDPLVIMYALKKQTEDKTINNKISTFIAKHSLQYKSYTRNPLSSVNTFFLDRNDIKKSLQTLTNFGKFIKENKTFGVIFPEGSRNKNGSVGEFKPGAFKIAKKEFLPIIPFTINNSVQGLNSKRKEKLKVEIIFHKKISATSIATQNTIAIAERIKSVVLSEFKQPEFKYVDIKEDIEKSRIAKKWEKKQVRLAHKEHKKYERERKQEERFLKEEQKEYEKYQKIKNKKGFQNDRNENFK